MDLAINGFVSLHTFSLTLFLLKGPTLERSVSGKLYIEESVKEILRVFYYFEDEGISTAITSPFYFVLFLNNSVSFL